MKKRLHIGFDFDDVIVPWYEPAHQLCVDAGITNGVTPYTWAPHTEYPCPLETWVGVLEQGILDGKPYDEPPYPGVLEAMQQVRERGHVIHIITARGFFNHGELIREHTVRAIEKYQIPHDTLTFSKDKAIIQTDYFIDDRELNVDAAWASGSTAYLQRRSWNENSRYPYKVESVEEFVDNIKGDNRW